MQPELKHLKLLDQCLVLFLLVFSASLHTIDHSLFFFFFKANSLASVMTFFSTFSCYRLALCSPLPWNITVTLYELLSTPTPLGCFSYSHLNDLSSPAISIHISACLSHRYLRLIETELIPFPQSLLLLTFCWLTHSKPGHRSWLLHYSFLAPPSPTTTTDSSVPGPVESS